jgi:hypothetical protein
MARQGEGRREEEVGYVAEDDGEESLEQVYQHRGFNTGGLVCGLGRLWLA